MATDKPKKTGRPAGSKTKPRLDAVAIATRCPKCGSTDREPYTGHPTVIEHGGIAPDGAPYTHVVKRRTVCLACGQHRSDTLYENRSPTARK